MEIAKLTTQSELTNLKNTLLKPGLKIPKSEFKELMEKIKALSGEKGHGQGGGGVYI